MNRLVSVLVVTGGAFLLMQGVRTHVAAQQGFITRPTCCSPEHFDYDVATECCTCKGSASVHWGCANYSPEVTLASTCSGGQGLWNVY